MRNYNYFSSSSTGRRVTTFLCVLFVFGLEAIVATALPLYGSVIQSVDASTVGLALALSNGAGFFFLPFCARWFDGGNMRPIMLICAGSMATGCIVMMFALQLGAFPFVFGALLFGIARIISVVALLTMIAKLPGDPSNNQGWNVALQRLGSLAALLMANVLFATGSWMAVFCIAVGLILLWWFCADRAASFARDTRQIKKNTALQDFSAAIAELRSTRVLTAGCLIILILICLLHGNSFFTMAHATKMETTELVSLVVSTVLLRDCISIAAGFLFSRALEFMGIMRMVQFLCVCAAIPFVGFVLLPSSAGVWLYVAAVLHGILVSWGSASANLIAAGPDTEGIGRRIGASQLPAGVALLAAPILFGLVLTAFGSGAGYLMLAAFLGVVAMVLARLAGVVLKRQ